MLRGKDASFRAWGRSPQLSHHDTEPPSMAVCPYRDGRKKRGERRARAFSVLSKALQRGEWNGLLWALFIPCSCSQSIRGSKEEMREVSQSSPTKNPTAWASTSPGPSDSTPEGDEIPQETSRSKGDNHSTCQCLIWTTRTQTFREIYERWHRDA